MRFLARTAIADDMVEKMIGRNAQDGKLVSLKLRTFTTGRHERPELRENACR